MAVLYASISVLNLMQAATGNSKVLRCTLKKYRFLKKVFAVMPWINHFWFPKEPFSEQFLEET